MAGNRLDPRKSRFLNSAGGPLSHGESLVRYELGVGNEGEYRELKEGRS